MQVFEFLAQPLHADAARKRRIDVDGFLCDTPALFRILQ